MLEFDCLNRDHKIGGELYIVHLVQGNIQVVNVFKNSLSFHRKKRGNIIS
jgi:hypothetical protein